MHRSGTSALARALNLLGAYVGPREIMMPLAEDNPAGFWERLDIYQFHERLLSHLATSWDVLFPPPPGWWKKPDIEPYRKELTSLITGEFGGHDLWMWKDPRTSFLLPLWQDVLGGLGVDVRYIICWRHPADVAASLQRRNGFTKEKAFALWQFHNLSSLYWTGGSRRAVVRYENLLRDFTRTLSKVAGVLDLPLRREQKDWDAALSSIRPDLCHSNSSDESLLNDPQAPEQIKRVYEFLAGSDSNGDLSDEMARLYDEYCDYAILFGAARRDDEIRDKDMHINDLTEVIHNRDLQIKERGAHIERLTEEVNDKIINIGLRDDAMRNQAVHIRELMEVIKNKDLQIKEIGGHVERLTEGVNDKIVNIGLRDDAMRNQAVHIRELMEVIKNKDLQNAEISARLINIENSLSWRTIRACLDAIDRVFGGGKKI